MHLSSIDLRPVVDDDVVQFFEHAIDSQAVAMAAPTQVVPTWPAFKEQWDRIKSNDAVMCRSVFLDDELTGYIARFEQEAVPSLSYWFGRQYWGKGLARTALSLFLKGIAERPLYARVAFSNQASVKVLVANGFAQIDRSSYFSKALDRDIEEIVLRLDA